MMDVGAQVGDDRPENHAWTDALYDAALASLLAYTARPPSRLSRFRSTLQRLHATYLADLERLPIEYRHWSHE